MTAVSPTFRPAEPMTLHPRWSGLRRLVRTSIEVVQRFAPARFVPLPSAARPESIAVLCVYRARNAGTVHSAVQALPPGTVVRLWALDRVAEALRDDTVGSGPGGRTELLNALVRSLPAEPDVLVIMDDDIRFVVGSIARLVHAGAAMGFDLYQPAHTRMSHTAFMFVRKRPLLFARETSFVEQGPMLALSRRAQRALLPLPEELVMGWGIEVRWHCRAKRDHLRLGIVDAVGIRHDPDMGASGHTYDIRPELLRLQAELDRAGLADIRDLQRTVSDVGPLAARRTFQRMR